jgi:poly-gamma-glutamate synthesis protein (capsule biosynthesis protein)
MAGAGRAGPREEPGLVKLFLCGDVMTGRGIDQILPHPSEPTLHEPFITSAGVYVELAERTSGHIGRPVDFPYVWGDALTEIAEQAPDLVIVNLETSITTSELPLPKGINYRMHPANAACLTAAGIDCCILANNHVLDWGVEGLIETLDTLSEVGIAKAGAGRTADEAARPAIFESAQGGRVLIFGLGSPTSGVDAAWAATESRPGVNVLTELSERSAGRLAVEIGGYRRDGDVVVVSVHWGENWGYQIPRQQRDFAHQLIDSGAADLVHGHSSHHAKGIEVYNDHLILYGCGDFVTDYEGIGGYEAYRPDLAIAYFASLEAKSGRLDRLEMVAFKSRRFRLERVEREDAAAALSILNREGEHLGTRFELTTRGSIELRR